MKPNLSLLTLALLAFFMVGPAVSAVNETTKLLDCNAFLPKLVDPNKLEKALISVLSESGRTMSRESCASAQLPG